MWMSNGLREQPIRDEERYEKIAPYPKKILAYRHNKQTALAESLADRWRFSFAIEQVDDNGATSHGLRFACCPVVISC